MKEVKLPKMSLPVGPVSNVGSMSNAARSAVGKAPGILGSIDDVAVRIFQAFPKMAVLKGIPLVGQLFTGYMFYDIMNRAMQTGDLRGAVPELANLAGNVIGGLSGFALGGMLGGLLGVKLRPHTIL